MWAEGMNHRHVCGVAAASDHHAAYPRCVMPRVDREPFAAKEHLDPCTEVHRRRIFRHTEVPKVSMCVSRGNIEAASQGDGEMCKIPAHAYTLAMRLERGARGASKLVSEREVVVHVVNDRAQARGVLRQVTE